MAKNITLVPGTARTISQRTINGDFSTNWFDIDPSSTGQLLIQLDVPSPDRYDTTKQVWLAIESQNVDGTVHEEASTTYQFGPDVIINGKSLYPPRISTSVDGLKGRTVRLSAYAGDKSNLTPTSLTTGATLSVT